MPYSRRGRVKLQAVAASDAAIEEAPAAAEDVATVSSTDYAAVVKAYTNRKGELSYELLNKALIQAAHSNPYVAEMKAHGATLEAIRDHVVKANFEAITGNRSLTQAEVNRIVELLDAVSPRSVLREFNEDLRHHVG